MTPQESAHLTPERWRTIESTLERVLDIAPELRADYLDRACAGDPELRREVESLIAADPHTGFLERPVLAEFAPPEDKRQLDAPNEPRAREVGRVSEGDLTSEMAVRLATAVQSRYTVERELGRGGMATVYRARDLRHRRQVAIKVLYPELSAILGPDRFLKEIELTASLHHPHILPLYESGNAAGLLYYVMPAIEGETLRARLTRERHLPIADALRIAREVADALSHAHARGIVHRDVKPENILLQGEHAMVADFGIALAVEHAGGERMTRTGLSPGTPQYMAPEQAMGDRVIDARADVYALGAVTYEMLAGEAPFTGPSGQAIIARMLTETATPLGIRRPTVPPHVEATVRWAMERIPADRILSAAAFAAALSDPSMTHDRIPAPPPPNATRARYSLSISRRMAVLLAGGALAAVAGAMEIGWMRGNTAVPSPAVVAEAALVRFAIDIDSLVRRVEAPAISPDGRTVVYVGTGPKGSQLFVRQLDEIAGHPINGSDYADRPFFSADGRSVGYVGKDAMWRVRLDGGKPDLVTRLASDDRFGGASWGSNNEILFGLAGRGLFRVPSNGDEATHIAVGEANLELVQPQLLPGGRAALVTVVRGNNSSHIGVADLATGKLREFANGSGARYAEGNIVFVRGDGSLFRQAFDLTTMQPTGSEVRIEQGLDAGGSSAALLGTLFDVAPNGTIAYRSSTASADDGGTRLYVTDRSGRELQAIASRVPWAPRFSPDGTRLAYGAYGLERNSSDLWITDLRSGTVLRLTDDDRDSNDPRWSPDGKSIAFSANVGNGKNLFVQQIGSSAAQELTHRDGSEWPSGWSPNGDGILFTQWSNNDSRDIWLQPTSGAAPRAIVATDAQETAGTLSPDGRWILYQSDESGRPEVYVDSYPTRGRRTRVSNGSGISPVWRGDGREIFYWDDDQLFASRVDEAVGNAPLARSTPTSLFRATYTPSELPMYDVSSDGSRFVLIAAAVRTGQLVVSTGMLAVGARRP